MSTNIHLLLQSIKKIANTLNNKIEELEIEIQKSETLYSSEEEPMFGEITAFFKTDIKSKQIQTGVCLDIKQVDKKVYFTMKSIINGETYTVPEELVNANKNVLLLQNKEL